MKKEFKFNFGFSIPNPIWKIIFKRRIKKACDFWNKNILPKVNEKIKIGQVNGHESFLWTIVWQEVQMWIQMANKNKVKEEFEWMCERRGFNCDQKEALEAIMKHVGLY